MWVEVGPRRARRTGHPHHPRGPPLHPDVGHRRRLRPHPRRHRHGVLRRAGQLRPGERAVPGGLRQAAHQRRSSSPRPTASRTASSPATTRPSGPTTPPPGTTSAGASPGRRRPAARVEPGHGADRPTGVRPGRPHPPGSPQRVPARCASTTSRYTPEVVSQITGIPEDKFVAVAEEFGATGTADKAGSVVYAVGLTHHTSGVQIIRGIGLLQMLLGNVGIPGGGVNAERGHANIQGNTDNAISWEILPGYLGIPRPAWRRWPTTSTRSRPSRCAPTRSTSSATTTGSSWSASSRRSSARLRRPATTSPTRGSRSRRRTRPGSRSTTRPGPDGSTASSTAGSPASPSARTPSGWPSRWPTSSGW